MSKIYEEPRVANNYIEFRFLSPFSGKMKRYRWTFDCNRLPEQNRLSFLIEKSALLSTKLKNGFNPNIHDFKTFRPDLEPELTQTKTGMNIMVALDQLLHRRKQYQKPQGYKSVSMKVEMFKRWLYQNDLEKFTIYQLERQHLDKFFADLDERKLSLRTKWNYMNTLNTLFEDFEREGFVEDKYYANPLKKIPKRTKQAMASSTRVIYTSAQVKQIKTYLQKNDPYLLDFIRFITYAFLRPVSTVRLLQVHMIDLENLEFNIPAKILKSGERETRIIQQIMLPTLQKMNLHQYPADYYVFSKHQCPGPEPVNMQYFSNHFKKVKKKLHLPRNYDMYSLRHTFATDLVRSGVPWHKIMKITGHKSLTAFERYVRFINAEKPEDLSEAYSLHL